MCSPTIRSTSSGRFAATLVSGLALAIAMLLSGCSGESAQPQNPAVASVASIPDTGKPSGPARTSTATTERPLIRLDTTPEEVDRMHDRYIKCLSENGMPSKAEQARTDNPQEYPAALAACASLEPEDYQEREKRENPTAFKDRQREQIRCMREHGLAIETGPDGWGYTNPARDMGSVWDDKCERQAFGG
jgi:hypothetical protein